MEACETKVGKLNTKGTNVTMKKFEFYGSTSSYPGWICIVVEYDLVHYKWQHLLVVAAVETLNVLHAHL